MISLRALVCCATVGSGLGLIHWSLSHAPGTFSPTPGFGVAKGTFVPQKPPGPTGDDELPPGPSRSPWAEALQEQSKARLANWQAESTAAAGAPSRRRPRRLYSALTAPVAYGP
jgi:hypothetical protein